MWDGVWRFSVMAGRGGRKRRALSLPGMGIGSVLGQIQKRTRVRRGAPAHYYFTLPFYPER